MFLGFQDGEERYDTQEAAIERAKMLARHQQKNLQIMIQKENVPLWFARLVRETWFEWLAYETLETFNARRQ